MDIIINIAFEEMDIFNTQLEDTIIINTDLKGDEI